jgi:hypothetical protein
LAQSAVTRNESGRGQVTGCFPLELSLQRAALSQFMSRSILSLCHYSALLTC